MQFTCDDANVAQVSHSLVVLRCLCWKQFCSTTIKDISCNSHGV